MFCLSSLNQEALAWHAMLLPFPPPLPPSAFKTLSGQLVLFESFCVLKMKLWLFYGAEALEMRCAHIFTVSVP